MKRSHQMALGSLALLACAFTACEREIIEPATQEILAPVDGPGTKTIDVHGTYDQIRTLDNGEWFEVPAYKASNGLPLTHIRRSEMLPEQFHATVTDGSSLSDGPVVDLAVYEGLTTDGKPALFVISPNQIA